MAKYGQSLVHWSHNRLTLSSSQFYKDARLVLLFFAVTFSDKVS
ncbi:hypothetical protein [Campylobacter phage CJLB-5]|nr:hypothetical protein [Campylobacter phage CJLB-5]